MTVRRWMTPSIFAVVMLSAVSAASAEPQLIWQAEGLDGPESVVLDADAGVFYVSNTNGGPTDVDGNGYIAKLSLKGEVLEKKWVSGLDSPKGLALHNGKLYVADITKIAVIDTKSGKILKTHVAPGSSFLNDAAADKDGRVFISDMLMNQIWLLEDGALTLWLENAALKNPNGLFAETDRLLVSSWGAAPKEDFSTDVPGGLEAIDFKTKGITRLGSAPSGNLDGLKPDGKGGYLVTDWFGGGLYRFAADGKAELLMDLNKGSADLEVIAADGLAIIPMMLDNKVVAYKLP